LSTSGENAFPGLDAGNGGNGGIITSNQNITDCSRSFGGKRGQYSPDYQGGQPGKPSA